jgi:hypothetical protein
MLRARHDGNIQRFNQEDRPPSTRDCRIADVPSTGFVFEIHNLIMRMKQYYATPFRIAEIAGL